LFILFISKEVLILVDVQVFLELLQSRLEVALEMLQSLALGLSFVSVDPKEF
jgi:hypothetical protein